MGHQKGHQTPFVMFINGLDRTMPRTYEETHPWLTFGLDTTLFSHRLWMALGEASSKSEHIAGVPLEPGMAREMHLLYLAKGAAATTAIEGNTLSEEEAERVIAGSLKLPPSQQYLADEINNIVDACNFIHTELEQSSQPRITVALLKQLNAMVLKNLELDEGVIAGELREHRVVVGKYRCAPPEDCDFLLERFCDVLNEFPVPNDGKNQFNIIKAIFAHLYFVWIHPFGDGNGRTARLIELYILLSSGFPTPAGHLLSNHYNKTRPEYYRKLNNAVKSMDDVVAFIQYSTQGLVDGLREQIKYIREQQWKVSWTNYVHKMFHDKNSLSDVRRRHLVLELSERKEAIQISKLTGLTGELAKEYFGKTQKTLIRDLNVLVELDLIERRRGTVRAKREAILAFLPWRSPEA